MELTKNGSAPAAAALVSISWIRDDFANGRRRYKAYAMMTGGGNPNPTVIGEATLEVPNLEIAKILQSAMGEMLAKQPVEIIQVK